MSVAIGNSGVQVRRRGQTNRSSMLASICCAAILGGCTSLLAEGTSAGAGVAGARRDQQRGCCHGYWLGCAGGCTGRHTVRGT
jgi:hypothetical protein